MPSTAKDSVIDYESGERKIFAKKIPDGEDIDNLKKVLGSLITEFRGDFFRLSISGNDPMAIEEGYDHLLLVRVICTNQEHRSEVLQVLYRI